MPLHLPLNEYSISQGSGCEAGIHSMYEIVDDENTHGIIQVDANNAFNTINRKVLLHNIWYLCPEIATYVYNCYQQPARLFVTEGFEISSAEGTTQGDPIAMPGYAISLIPLMSAISSPNIKHVAFADDLTGGGTIKRLRLWWESVLAVGPSLGYYVNPKKYWLIVKSKYLNESLIEFKNSGLNITCDGRKHLGAAIGSEKYRSEYVESLITKWVTEINVLSEIAKIEPHSAYSAFIHGHQHKYTYFLRTIPNISNQLKVLDDAIDRFIKSLLMNYECNSFERELLSLPAKMGGLGIIMPSKISDIQFAASKQITRCHRTENFVGY